MKIVVLDGYTLNPGDNPWTDLEGLATLAVYDRTPNELILERIGDAEIVLKNKVPLSRSTIEAAPKLSGVCVSSQRATTSWTFRRRANAVSSFATCPTMARRASHSMRWRCCG
jgi:glycerate dehydrogenase